MLTTTVTAAKHVPSAVEQAETTVASGYEFRLQPIRWMTDELTPSEVERLVMGLDSLRDEPTRSFTSTPEAITYLRSLIRRKS